MEEFERNQNFAVDKSGKQTVILAINRYFEQGVVSRSQLGDGGCAF